jgi:hypothetical protein
MTQLVLPLHECAVDPAAVEFATEPLHSAIVGAAPTETSCLCVQV